MRVDVERDHVGIEALDELARFERMRTAILNADGGFLTVNGGSMRNNTSDRAGGAIEDASVSEDNDDDDSDDDDEKEAEDEGRMY